MRSTEHTEQDLLVNMAAGERNATEKIYRQYYPTITKWIIGTGGSGSDAEDIYQDAMVVLYEKAQNEDFRLQCKIGTYLFAVSKHLWYKKMQQMKKAPVSFTEQDEDREPGYEDDVKAHYERENHYRQLEEALEKLGEPCCSILRAYYHKDKSMQEIAADFGYTNPENAKTQKYKCLMRLKKIFYSVKDKITD